MAFTEQKRIALRALLSELEAEIRAQRQLTEFHENWNFYNHLERLHSETLWLSNSLNESMLDPEVWRAW